MTTFINFCAGPSAGKTTAALHVAAHLKHLRKDVLYVPEFATKLVVVDRVPEMDDQLFILGQQFHELYMANGKFEYVVTDSPLIMMLHYLYNYGLKKLEEELTYRKTSFMGALEQMIVCSYRVFDNKTFFVDRADRKYLQAGRIQNEEESRAIDKSIIDLLEYWHTPYEFVTSGAEALALLGFK